MLPTHEPSLLPTHQKTSLLVRVTGEGGSLNVPVATNETCPLGEFCASAVAGVILTVRRWRPLPHAESTNSQRSPAIEYSRIGRPPLFPRSGWIWADRHNHLASIVSRASIGDDERSS